jgi:aldose 1-epimerase
MIICSHPLEVELNPFGASILAIRFPDKNGKLANLVLSYPTIDQYFTDPFYLGGVVGRYSGRISHGRLEVGDHLYLLERNEAGRNHLHGGVEGFNKKPWQTIHQDHSSVEFSYLSPSFEEGYPGDLKVSVRYDVDRESCLRVTYRAESSADTHLNLTQHSYFNLSGDGVEDIYDHHLSIYSDVALILDRENIPTGEMKSYPFKQGIEDTVMDDSFVWNESINDPRLAATLRHEKSGRFLQVHTTEPSIHVYTGDGLSNPFRKRSGICLETQHFPDSPHHKHFPSTLLKAGETFTSQTVFEFGVNL